MNFFFSFLVILLKHTPFKKIVVLNLKKKSIENFQGQVQLLSL